MLRKTLTALVVGAAAAFAGASAQAGVIGDPFEVEADGTFTEMGGVIDLLATVSDQSPGFTFDDFDGTLTLDAGGGPVTFDFGGSFTLTSDDGDLSGSLTGSYFDAGDFASAAGTIDITGGTGLYDGLAGDGAFTIFFDNVSGEAQIKLGITLIPAPAALACFGMALLGGPRRRRRH